MPELDLSTQIPPHARWLKIHYEMAPTEPGANLIARLWSGKLDEAVVIRGESGDTFVCLNRPQALSYQRPVNVSLKLKVVAYKAVTERPVGGSESPSQDRG